MTEVLISRKHEIRMSRRDIVRGLTAGYVVALTGCVYDEDLGRSQLLVVSDAQVAQMAASSWTALKKEEKVTRDPKYVNRMSRVGPRIQSAAGRGGERWEYEVFDSDQKNAFALPGGRIGFYTGILDIMENDDQIATVMGHEVAHVTKRHSAERVSQQMAAQGVTLGAAIAVGADDNPDNDWIAGALGLGATFGVLLPYSRRHETEADRIGVRYMHAAGYDANEAVRFWQNMAAQSDGPRPPEFMSTHPSPATRISDLQREIAALPPRRG